MPKFIKLTKVDGEQVYLNPDFIYKLLPTGQGEKPETIVCFNDGDIGGDYVAVVETAEEILAKIEGKAYVK